MRVQEFVRLFWAQAGVQGFLYRAREMYETSLAVKKDGEYRKVANSLTLAEAGITEGSECKIVGQIKPQYQQVEACFIATAVYYDIDSPQVIILRKFRDRVLLKSNIGKTLVALYYQYSPFVAARLRNSYIPNRVVRFCLDILVEVLRRTGME